MEVFEMNDRPRILIFTGDGKGKTTAALGMAFRAIGHGRRVCMIQFIKNDSATGEFLAAEKMGDFEIYQMGQGFIPDPTDARFSGHRLAAQEACRKAGEILVSKRYFMIILDEICVAVAKGLVDESQAIDLLKNASADSIVVLTGRGATPGLIELADTVTEMRCVKHGYHSGFPAQEGVEF
jgi:cob(I)alamin adenosyltransferase